jgi:hypothetical protein
MPLACYLKKNAMAYITGSRMAFHFRAAAKAVRPNISKDDKQQYSAHSMRVWACVLLDEAGKSPDYINKRLRCMGDSFECTCAILISSRTSIARPYGRHQKRLWTMSVHFLLTYFVSASCPRRLLVMTKIWGYFRTTWINGATK